MIPVLRRIRWYLSFVIPMCEAAGMSRHTHIHTYIHTYTQDNYSNPRCACAPRVNNNGSHTLLTNTLINLAAHAQVKSMDDNCGEWVECMGVASGCGEQEVGVASGSGWNLWVWLLGVVVSRYIDFLILLLLYLFFFAAASLLFVNFFMFSVLVPILFCN